MVELLSRSELGDSHLTKDALYQLSYMWQHTHSSIILT